eukprot:753923-Hanusia_phi.AAC.2
MVDALKDRSESGWVSAELRMYISANHRPWLDYRMTSNSLCLAGIKSSGQRTTKLLAVAKGACKGIVLLLPLLTRTFPAPVTENEFKLFQRAMSEQGLSKSTTADVSRADCIASRSPSLAGYRKSFKERRKAGCLKVVHTKLSRSYGTCVQNVDNQPNKFIVSISFKGEEKIEMKEFSV